jgi:hypothetical protein
MPRVIFLLNEFVLTIGASVPPAPPQGPSFGPGQYRVNVDIAPGRYYTVPVSGCYWERQSGFSGSLNDVIANEFVSFDAGQWIVDILSSDRGFETDSQCGVWFSTPRRGAQSTIAPGVWLVGAQIAPGTYRVNAGSGCYWARLRDFTGNISGIIDNEFVSNGGQQFVTISLSDAGFENDADCGTWSRVSGDTTHREESRDNDIKLHWALNDQQEAGRGEPKPLIKQ